ncbi:MAG: hypothetical protein JRN32_02350, partial [Nitrososphaerota archaeon]|nr:hypothetical protein [Nitrososphaerota archaeon]
CRDELINDEDRARDKLHINIRDARFRLSQPYISILKGEASGFERPSARYFRMVILLESVRPLKGLLDTRKIRDKIEPESSALRYSLIASA